MQLKQSWIKSYTSDRVAFTFELISFVFTVGASPMLAVNADNPKYVTCISPISRGSITQLYASWRRGAAWIMLLTSHFACINVFGYGVAAGIW